MADSSPRHDNNASTTAMDKLQAIDQQRAAVERRLVERLQRQLQQLRALLCAAKWRLTTLRRRRPEAYTQDLVDDATKKLRMEVGAFEYAAKEQSELLTRALFQLDDILSNGDDAVKSARKALVLSVQQLLERADAVKAKAALLKQFAERLLAHLPVVPEAQDEDMEETAEPQTKVAVEQDDENDWEHVEAEDVRPLFASDDEAEEAEPMEQESAEAAVEDAVMLQPEETADDNADGDDEDARTENQDDEEEEPEESDSEPEDEEEQAETPQHEEQCEASEQMLPVWRPYYQIQKRDDGVYIVANLRGVDPRYVQVHAMPQQGVLRIFGVKYPTQKDILLSRLSGAPTFGRFEIVERFPTQMINLENASQQLREDGTLQVRLPFYLVQHPRIMRRVSPFQPHRLVVW